MSDGIMSQQLQTCKKKEKKNLIYKIIGINVNMVKYYISQMIDSIFNDLSNYKDDSKLSTPFPKTVLGKRKNYLPFTLGVSSHFLLLTKLPPYLKLLLLPTYSLDLVNFPSLNREKRFMNKLLVSYPLGFYNSLVSHKTKFKVEEAYFSKSRVC